MKMRRTPCQSSYPLLVMVDPPVSQHEYNETRRMHLAETRAGAEAVRRATESLTPVLALAAASEAAAAVGDELGYESNADLAIDGIGQAEDAIRRFDAIDGLQHSADRARSKVVAAAPPPPPARSMPGESLFLADQREDADAAVTELEFASAVLFDALEYPWATPPPDEPTGLAATLRDSAAENQKQVVLAADVLAAASHHAGRIGQRERGRRVTREQVAAELAAIADETLSDNPRYGFAVLGRDPTLPAGLALEVARAAESPNALAGVTYALAEPAYDDDTAVAISEQPQLLMAMHDLALAPDGGEGPDAGARSNEALARSAELLVGLLDLKSTTRVTAFPKVDRSPYTRGVSGAARARASYDRIAALPPIEGPDELSSLSLADQAAHLHERDVLAEQWRLARGDVEALVGKAEAAALPDAGLLRSLFTLMDLHTIHESTDHPDWLAASLTFGDDLGEGASQEERNEVDRHRTVARFREAARLALDCHAAAVAQLAEQKRQADHGEAMAKGPLAAWAEADAALKVVPVDALQNMLTLGFRWADGEDLLEGEERWEKFFDFAGLAYSTLTSTGQAWAEFAALQGSKASGWSSVADLMKNAPDLPQFSASAAVGKEGAEYVAARIGQVLAVAQVAVGSLQVLWALRGVVTDEDIDGALLVEGGVNVVGGLAALLLGGMAGTGVGLLVAAVGLVIVHVIEHRRMVRELARSEGALETLDDITASVEAVLRKAGTLSGFASRLERLTEDGGFYNETTAELLSRATGLNLSGLLLEIAEHGLTLNQTFPGDAVEREGREDEVFHEKRFGAIPRAWNRFVGLGHPIDVAGRIVPEDPESVLGELPDASEVLADAAAGVSASYVAAQGAVTQRAQPASDRVDDLLQQHVLAKSGIAPDPLDDVPMHEVHRLAPEDLQAWKERRALVSEAMGRHAAAREA